MYAAEDWPTVAETDVDTVMAETQRAYSDTVLLLRMLHRPIREEGDRSTADDGREDAVKAVGRQALTFSRGRVSRRTHWMLHGLGVMLARGCGNSEGQVGEAYQPRRGHGMASRNGRVRNCAPSSRDGVSSW